MARLFLLFLGAILLACGTNAPVPANTAAPPGSESPPAQGLPTDRMELRPGETARVDAGNLTIAFDAVVQDSRCPLTLRCFWEGNAAVRLTLRTDAGGSTTVTLYTSHGPRSVACGDVKIFLEDLKPYPTEAGPQDPSVYRVVLAIAVP